MTEQELARFDAAIETACGQMIADILENRTALGITPQQGTNMPGFDRSIDLVQKLILTSWKDGCPNRLIGLSMGLGIALGLRTGRAIKEIELLEETFKA